MKKIIFIAGPVRAGGNKEAQQKNIESARKFVRLFIENHIPYYSPHLNIDQEVVASGNIFDSFSWDLNAEFLLRSQAIAVLPGWENSDGTKKEIENAAKRNLPIFYLDKEGIFEEMIEWVNE